MSVGDNEDICQNENRAYKPTANNQNIIPLFSVITCMSSFLGGQGVLMTPEFWGSQNLSKGTTQESSVDMF